MLIIILLLTLCHLHIATSLTCSKSPPIHHKTTLIRDRDTGDLSEQTLVTISLGLKETACFSLDNAKYWHNKAEVYGITLNDVKNVLNYRNSYSFGIPKVDVKCICDCPGAEDFCNSHSDSCKENGYAGQGACFNWYEGGHRNTGCTAFLSGSAEVCCSITVAPANKTVWRAVELESGANRAVFNVTSLNSQETTMTEVDIEGGHPIQKPFYMTISAPAIQSPLKGGWYFGKDSGSVFYGGVEMNSLSEYDTDKLGWYKFTRGAFEMDKSQVMDSFSVEANNCDADDLSVEFDNKNDQETLNEATELNQLYKTSLAYVERLDSERRVEAYFRQYSNIELTITLKGDYNVVQVFDVSHFEDFEGVVMMDKHSNYFVNITIFEGAGSIRGNLTVDGESTDVFKINIPQHQAATSVFYIRLSSLCEADERAELCLYTDAGFESVMCKPVSCDREPLQEFELPDSAIDYEKGEKMSILSPATWFKHLNPAEWFNGIKNWKEAVIMITEIVGILTLLGVALKVLKVLGCLGRCWQCILGKDKNKNKKSKSTCCCIDISFLNLKRKEKIMPKHSTECARETERKELLEELIDQLAPHDGSTVHQNINYRHRSQSSESSPSYLLSSPRYIEMDDIAGNPVTLLTTGEPGLFLYDKNSTLSTTAHSTPQSSRSGASTLPERFTPPGRATPPAVPPRTDTPGISLTPCNGKKSSTLPATFHGSPPPSRIPLPRFGRRHTTEHVGAPQTSSPGNSLSRIAAIRQGVSSPIPARLQGSHTQVSSPNLARVLIRPAILNDRELEMVYNSTESLISRGGERDGQRRPGHSRNGSRVLLLKNSSEI